MIITTQKVKVKCLRNYMPWRDNVTFVCMYQQMFICGWEPTALVKKTSELKANDTTVSQ